MNPLNPLPDEQPDLETPTPEDVPMAATPGEDSESYRPDEVIVGTFFIEGREFALPATRVREVVHYPGILSPMPLCSPFVDGVFSLRGEVLPVIDAARFMGIESTSEPNERRVAVVSSGRGHVGLVFHGTGEVLRVPRENLRTIEGQGISSDGLIQGVLHLPEEDRFIQVLSPEALGLAGGVPLASAESEEQEVKSYSKAIVARVGEYEIAFPIGDVLEIQEGLSMHSNECYFEHCRGVVQLRGEVRAVMDFRRVLGTVSDEPGNKLLFLVHEGACVGLEVDALVETIEFADEDLLEMPSIPESGLGDVVSGVLPAGYARHVLMADVQGLYEKYSIAQGVAIFGEPASMAEVSEIEEVEECSFFTFKIADSELSFPLGEVSEVCDYPEDVVITNRTDEAVCGLMKLRDEMIPLVDVAPVSEVAIDVEDAEHAEHAERAVVVVDVAGRRQGLVVDAVESIVRGKTTRMSKAALLAGEGRKGSLLKYSAGAAVVECVDGSSEILLILDPVRFAGSLAEPEG